MDLRERALRELSPTARRRALAVSRDLATVWCSEDYMERAVSQFSTLLPDCKAALYTRTEEGGLGEIGHTMSDRPSSDWTQITGEGGQVLKLYQYTLRGPDRLANLAVNTHSLFRGRPAMLDKFRSNFLHHHGLWYQLRAALYEGDRFQMFCCLLRERGGGDFKQHEQAMLQAVLPALQDGYLLRRKLDTAPIKGGQLGPILDLLDQPAFLVSGRGSVVFQNSSARLVFPRLPDWMSAAGKDPEAEWTTNLARVQRVDLEGRSLYLVLPCEALCPVHLPDNTKALINALPASLCRVAELLAKGLTEKDVATQTDLSLATVRTYTSRIYRRLGVHTRLELARLFDNR